MRAKNNRSMIIMFLTPAVLGYLLIYLYPTVRTLIMSFFYAKGVADPVSMWTFVGLNNIRELLNTPIFVRSLINLFKIWIFGGVFTFAFALFFSVTLHSGARGKSFWRAAIYLPNVITAIAIANMWNMYIYNPKYGMLTTFFKAIGLEKLSQTQWTGPGNLFWAMLIAYSFGCVGYYLLILLSGMERIPKDFYEAARLEGANEFSQFISISVPLLKPVFVTCLIFWTTATIGFFVWSQMFSAVINGVDTITPVVQMLNYAFGKGTGNAADLNSGKAAAIGTILCIITVAIFWIINLLNRGDKYEY